MGQRFCTCRINGLQAIGQNGSEDIDHLAVAAGLPLELSAHPPYSNGQLPSFEGCTVAQCARLAREDRQIMQGIIDRFSTPKGAFMLANNLAILPAFQPIRIGAYLNRTTDRAGINGVAIVVKPHEAGL